jgi:proline utilization trans-activator
VFHVLIIRCVAGLAGLTCAIVWLAPTSTWSFTARLILLLEDKLDLESANEQYLSPSLRGEDIFSLEVYESRPSDQTHVPDISGLPSVDYALYLLRTVRFHLGETYHLIEEESFLSELNDFYFKSAAEKAASSRLWFVQFLIVLAFGNAFLLHSASTEKTPGSLFFSRAMALIPDHLTLWKDSILAVEVSALAGLYLYSVDKRESAHLYVSNFMSFHATL